MELSPRHQIQEVEGIERETKLSPRDKAHFESEERRLEDTFAYGLWLCHDLVCVYTDDAPPAYYRGEARISKEEAFIEEELETISWDFDHEPHILPTHEELCYLIPKCAVVIDLRNWSEEKTRESQHRQPDGRNAGHPAQAA